MIAGQNIANPVSSILCLSMMFNYSFSRLDIAQVIENAVLSVFSNGYRTIDLYDEQDKTLKLVGTKEFGDLVVSFL